MECDPVKQPRDKIEKFRRKREAEMSVLMNQKSKVDRETYIKRRIQVSDI